MKRIVCVLMILALLLTLTACSKAVGGTYELSRATFDGKAVNPANLSMNMRFTLEPNGIGTARYNTRTVDITWSDNGSTVTVKDGEKTLEFKKDGKNLILHDNGMILYFTPAKTEEETD